MLSVEQESSPETSEFSFEILEKRDGKTFSVSNLFCRYSQFSPPVINGISFDLNAGVLTGVCGRSGSGKSTLALAISRCMDCIHGRMELCGIDVFKIPIKIYRKLVQVFPQDSYILSGSVKDYLDPYSKFSENKICSVLDSLNSAIHRDSQNQVTLGMVILNGGGNLSAGQKQILALARASLAVDAKVVILDEITSNMDVQVGRLALQIVKNELLSRNIAVLLIAHVLQDILSCDNVLVMSAGEIIERSEPRELLERKNN